MPGSSVWAVGYPGLYWLYWGPSVSKAWPGIFPCLPLGLKVLIYPHLFAPAAQGHQQGQGTGHSAPACAWWQCDSALFVFLCSPAPTMLDLLSCQQPLFGGISRAACQEHPRTSSAVCTDFSGQIPSVQTLQSPVSPPVVGHCEHWLGWAFPVQLQVCVFEGQQCQSCSAVPRLSCADVFGDAHRLWAKFTLRPWPPLSRDLKGQF